MLYRLGLLTGGLVALLLLGAPAGVTLHRLGEKSRPTSNQDFPKKVCAVPLEYLLRPDCWHGTEDELIATWIATAEVDKKAAIRTAPGWPKGRFTLVHSHKITIAGQEYTSSTYRGQPRPDGTVEFIVGSLEPFPNGYHPRSRR